MDVLLLWAGKGAALVLLLAGASCCDVRSRQVPDKYSMAIAVVAVVWPDPAKWWGILCALPFFIGALTIGGIGGADVKIMGAAGMVLGLMNGMLAIVIGLTAMLIFHVTKCLFLKERKWKQSYPLVPFLAVGIVFEYLTLIPRQ